MRTNALAAIGLLLTGCGGGGSGEPSGTGVFPGGFWIVDRAALYDPALNLLANGGFEEEVGGVPSDWQIIAGSSGAASADLVPRDAGRAIRIVTSSSAEELTLAGAAVPVEAGAARYYLAFEARTGFGVLDEGWGGSGTEEGQGSAGVTVTASLRWGLASGGMTETSVRRVLHSLRSWRPHLTEVDVSSGATSVQVRFHVKGNVPNSGAEPHETFIDDVRLFPEPPGLAPRPVDGFVTAGSNGAVSFAGTAGGFRIEADFAPSADGEGAVTGAVVNQSGVPAAVDLIYGLDSEGTRVDYDISRGSAVADSTRYYADPVSADGYSGLTMSPVPLGSVTDTAGSTLGLAVPLDPVRIFLFRYDAVLKRMEIVHRFGLHAAGPQDRASFAVHVLRTSSPWGYRELWRRYGTERVPAVSAVPRPTVGGTGAFFAALFDVTDPAVMAPLYPDLAGMIQDFGLRTVLHPIGSNPGVQPKFLEHLETYGLEAYNYDYPWILEPDGGPATGPPPSYVGAEDIVSALSSGTPATTFGVLHRIKAQTVFRDARGDLRLNRNWAPDYGGGRWLLRIPVELRPEKSPYLETAASQKYLPAFSAGPRIVGVNLDGFLKESKVLDDAADATSAGPLTYDPDTGLPGAPAPAGHLAYLSGLRARLDAEGHADKRMSGNLTASGPSIFGMASLDAAGWEASPTAGINFDHREFNLRRMMLQGKPLTVIFKGTWWTNPQHQPALRGFFETAALLGFYPNLIESHTPPPVLQDATEQTWYRDLHREVIPVLDAMHAGGWQVIPHAWASGGNPEALRIERFGSGAPYFFSVLNNPTGILGEVTAVSQTVTATVDLSALGLGNASAVSIAFGTAGIAGTKIEGGRVEITFDLAAGQGAVLRIE